MILPEATFWDVAESSSDGSTVLLLDLDLTELAFLMGGGAASVEALRLRSSTILAYMDDSSGQMESRNSPEDNDVGSDEARGMVLNQAYIK